ncbi:MAG TPA: FIST N-terminal domain-containing protein, partial [Planctomycetota bacterium]|nr:FIST N-terminal domain-containing protein [Planctomycetota bacterium]
MRWGSAVSVRESAVDAVSEAAEAAAHGLGGATPDLAFVFLSGYGAAGEAQAAERLPALTGSERALGCTSGGVVGGGQEIERKRAVSVTLASLPGVGVRTFHVSADALPDEDAAPRDWADLIGVPPDAEPSFVLVSDAVGVAGPRLVEGLDFAYPASPKVGGLESGGRPPGRGRLFLGGRFEAAGAVGVALTGDVIMATAVAQGARPFGAAGVVTRAERHFVHTIDRAPALEFVRTQLATLDEDDQRRPLGAVCVGLEADPLDAVSPDTGDWLIRNLLGADEDGGA